METCFTIATPVSFRLHWVLDILIFLYWTKDDNQAPGHKDSGVHRFAEALADQEGISACAFFEHLQHCIQEVPLSRSHGVR